MSVAPPDRKEIFPPKDEFAKKLGGEKNPDQLYHEFKEAIP